MRKDENPYAEMADRDGSTIILLLVVFVLGWMGAIGYLSAWSIGLVDQKYLFLSPFQASLLITSAMLFLMGCCKPRLRIVLAIVAVLLAASTWFFEYFVSDWAGQRFGFAQLGQLFVLLGAFVIVRPGSTIHLKSVFQSSRQVVLVALLGTFLSTSAAYLLLMRDVDYAQDIAHNRLARLQEQSTQGVLTAFEDLERMANGWRRMDGRVPFVFSQVDMGLLLQRRDDLQRLTFLNPDLSFYQDALSSGSPIGVLENALQNAQFRAFLEHTMETNDVHLFPVAEIQHQSTQALIILPFAAGEYNGHFLVATASLLDLLGRHLENTNQTACCLVVRHGDQVLFAHEQPKDANVLAHLQSSTDLHHDMTLDFDLRFLNPLETFERIFLPEGALLFGLLFTFLANRSQRLAGHARTHAERLLYRAYHDETTDLGNRRALFENLEAICASGALNHRHVVVIMVRMVDLQLIRDSQGYEAVDYFLRSIARRLEETVGDQIKLANMVGIGFVAVTEESADEQTTHVQTQLLIDQLLKTVTTPVEYQHQSFQLRAYAGVSFQKEGDVDCTALVHQADLASRAAQEQMDPPWAYYSEVLDERANRYQQIYAALVRNLEQKAFWLAYQPILDPNTGHVYALEALLRMPGGLTPEQFIPVAEESRKIIELTDRVLEQACQDAAFLANHGMSQIAIAVNISPVYFHLSDFLIRIRDVIGRHGLAPHRLKLEITESMLLDNLEVATRRLEALNGMGVSVALDDFGTGYSSLSYLSQLPLSSLKVDRSFMKNVPEDFGNTGVLLAILSIAHHLGIYVVVEGVETAEQFNFLRQERCDAVQGFLFEKPIALDEIYARLQKNGGRYPITNI
ncbi:putative bifunctional diguanylate cyclase/phosphodiesterase [Orrella sp. 11846]|uniref:putative bifunctional diguanylate cyclase/phosphodiesterase n=1 Tax=Orrella sp. 11846 TaxID=3409913 RepID=UPI003B5946BC